MKEHGSTSPSRHILQVSLGEELMSTLGLKEGRSYAGEGDERGYVQPL